DPDVGLIRRRAAHRLAAGLGLLGPAHVSSLPGAIAPALFVSPSLSPPRAPSASRRSGPPRPSSCFLRPRSYRSRPFCYPRLSSGAGPIFSSRRMGSVVTSFVPPLVTSFGSSLPVPYPLGASGNRNDRNRPFCNRDGVSSTDNERSALRKR